MMEDVKTIVGPVQTGGPACSVVNQETVMDDDFQKCPGQNPQKRI